MAAPKFKTALERESVKAEVSRLHRRGYSQYDIAKVLKTTLKVSISQPMICNYLRDIREAYIESAVEDRKLMVYEKLAQYKEIVKEAWDQFERLKKGRRKVVRDSGDGANGSWDKTSVTEEEAEGSQYLRIVMDAHKAVRELMGLDEAVKLDVQNTHLLLDWNRVMEEMARPYQDVVGEVIVKELEGPKEDRS